LEFKKGETMTSFEPLTPTQDERIMAAHVFQGKPFRYAVIGKRIERFMQPDPNPAPPANP